MEQIKSPADLKYLSTGQMQTLAAQIRELIIKTVAQNGGHLATGFVGTAFLCPALTVTGHQKEAVDLKPALRLTSHVTYVKDVAAGTPISYGGTFVAPEQMKVATIPVGYGDGYPRSLSNKGYVLIHGKRARILGRVCMDQFMVDVTDIPDTKFMDPVTLIGEDGGDRITVEDLSELSGRFNYEFVCCLGKRIPRVYKRGGKISE